MLPETLYVSRFTRDRKECLAIFAGAEKIQDHIPEALSGPAEGTIATGDLPPDILGRLEQFGYYWEAATHVEGLVGPSIKRR